MKIETIVAQAGIGADPEKGSISVPIYHSTTFRHPALGVSTGYDYSRTANPTRKVLEDTAALLEEGCRGYAFSTGMAAVTAVLMLLSPGDHLIVSDDLYGGTYRLLEKVFGRYGVTARYIDTSDLSKVAEAIDPGKTKAIFIESPSNPLMKITDITGVASLAKSNNMLTIVDNTFMTPYLLQPIKMGADIVLHSATKYLGGHNDVLGGIVVAANPEICEKIGFIQNSTGNVLGPQDSWLIIRGIKTLALRMERQQENALKIANWLNERPEVSKVYYPGIAAHAGHEILKTQAKGFGAMVSFKVTDTAFVEKIVNGVKLISFAESLGGVESLITYPAKQTHGDIPKEIRDQIGVTEDLLRFSVGIEDADDLIYDLKQAIEGGNSI
ncbi:PLP-dependent aspartate aminotransferase family protein [Petroclostridium sp. X23]|uniref:trans-sulfuration enzyme family protein n=1 Tax=Petroclostridium sp. X23 TaxID=3045146 RepID=UPI0024ACB465|nr:PLP-dependent aspartate aminotransferase family protein [Petroclostridium sp. X23]WHH57644.1 PLP-dependent aspartate aminotransferase family protein [Petroclostridium sp. X23]